MAPWPWRHAGARSLTFGSRLTERRPTINHGAAAARAALATFELGAVRGYPIVSHRISGTSNLEPLALGLTSLDNLANLARAALDTCMYPTAS